MSNTRLDRAGVKAKFDVFPEQIVDYLALVGDSSDNIPGITGVGPKTAAKWLNQYQTLDELIAHAADIGGKVGENLRNELPMLELSRKLATIDTRLSLDVSAEELRAGAPDLAAAARAVHAPGAARAAQVAWGRTRRRRPRRRRRGGRRRRSPAAATIPAAPDPAAAVAVDRSAPPPRNYHTMLSRGGTWTPGWRRLAAAPLISFDTETDSLDYMQAPHRRRVVRGCAGRGGVRAARARLSGRAAAARSRQGAGGVEAAARGRRR